jgi:hypothetical protein
MKIIVAGSRDCTDRKLIYEAIEEGIKELGKPTCILHGDCRGVDKIAEDWAKENGVNYISYPADWNNVKCQGALIKERVNPWTKKKEKYNANAGFQRNEKMAIDGEALISINIGNTPGTKNMVSLAKQYNLKIYEYNPQPLNSGDFEIVF